VRARRTFRAHSVYLPAPGPPHTDRDGRLLEGLKILAEPRALITIPGDKAVGSRVAVTVTDEVTDDGVVSQMRAQFVAHGEFVTGSIWCLVGVDELPALQNFLDDLDGGRSTSWRSQEKGAQIFVEFEEFKVLGLGEVWTEPWLTLKYDSIAECVTLRIDVTDDWLDEAYRVLDEVMDHYGVERQISSAPSTP
jgi:hypothetical protein